MRAPPLRVAIPLFAFAVALALFGCGSDSGAPTGGGGGASDTTTDLDRAEGGVMAREVEASVTSFSPVGASVNGGEATDRTRGAPSILASRVAGASLTPTLLAIGWHFTGCGVAAPSAAPDGDQDGIPDSVTITYALPACALAGVRGKDEGDITGVMTITDQSADIDSRAFDIKVTNLRYAFTNATKTFGETRNGTRDITGDTLLITQANNIVTVFDSAGRNQTLTNTMSVTYAPTGRQFIDDLSLLSNGSVTVNGGTAYTDGTSSDTFTIATVTPLVYNPSCAQTGTEPIETGEIAATVTTSGKSGVLHIVWAHCGIAMVTRSTS
jgi:hypothetical protein